MFRQFDTLVNQKCTFLNESYSRSLKCKGEGITRPALVTPRSMEYTGEGIDPALPTIWLHMLCTDSTPSEYSLEILEINMVSIFKIWELHFLCVVLLFKVIEKVISSDPPCKYCHDRFATIPLKILSFLEAWNSYSLINLSFFPAVEMRELIFYRNYNCKFNRFQDYIHIYFILDQTTLKRYHCE